MSAPTTPWPTGDRAELGDIASAALTANSEDHLGGQDLGFFGIGVPERLNGSGGDITDLAVVIEAAGHAASRSTLGPTAIFLQSLLAAGTSAALTVVEEVMDASSTAAVALAHGHPRVSDWCLEVHEGSVSASGLLVMGHQDARHALVPVSDGVGVSDVAVVPLDHEAVTVEATPAYDVSRDFASITVRNLQLGDVVRLGTASFLPSVAAATLLSAADSIGAARRSLSRTIEFAGQREQFGQPIGSFQAYQHRIASAFVELRLGQSQVRRAAASGSISDALACHTALRASTLACGEAVQLHGAIGFSWETGLHIGLKRTKVNELAGTWMEHEPGLFLGSYIGRRAKSTDVMERTTLA